MKYIYQELLSHSVNFPLRTLFNRSTLTFSVFLSTLTRPPPADLPFSPDYLPASRISTGRPKSQIRDIVKKMFPEGNADLQPITHFINNGMTVTLKHPRGSQNLISFLDVQINTCSYTGESSTQKLSSILCYTLKYTL